MPKPDKDLIPGYDVQVIPVGANGTPVAPQATNAVGVPTQVPGGNGYVMTSAPNTPIIFVPQPPVPPQQPSLVVITLSPKKEDKKEKKSSSVFQRL